MILDQVRQILSAGKSMTLAEIADRVPDLSGRAEGPEILRLLLRLDRRFEQMGDRWYVVADDDSAGRIVDAVRLYFKETGKPGEMLVHLSQAVAERTGEDIERAAEVILDRFQSVTGGKMILNKEKK